MSLHSVLSRPSSGACPQPLENGDRLARCEFWRRYVASPHLKKAELIEGVVYMPSPVRADTHGKPHAVVMIWLGQYFLATPGVELADNATVRLDADNVPQPDALLRIEGGTSRMSDDGYVEGPPELIVEVAASSASHDLHDKLRVYRRSGVREYVVWRTLDGSIDWFVLEDDEYRPLAPNAAGVLASRVFPGLWLDTDALLAGDLAGALATLREGLASPEHAAFAPRLRDAGDG